MKKTILLTMIIILTFVDMAYTADKWDKEDIALATTFTVATIIDWGQTRDMSKNNYEKKDSMSKTTYYKETNIYLGKYPSIGKIDAYMLTSLLGSLATVHILNSKWRKKVLFTLSTIELWVINHNYNNGLKINFEF